MDNINAITTEQGLRDYIRFADIAIKRAKKTIEDLEQGKLLANSRLLTMVTSNKEVIK